MRYFGPLFDRSIARKLSEKFGVLDSPSMPGFGVSEAQYQGHKQRILSKEEAQDLWRYSVLAIMSDAWTGASDFELFRTRILKEGFKPYKPMTAYAWATATDYALAASASGAYCEVSPCGRGDLLFRTVAFAPGGVVVVRYTLFNASPSVHFTTHKPGTGDAAISITEPEHEELGDGSNAWGMFTGWLNYLPGDYRQGFVLFARGFSGSPSRERVYCVHSETGFSGWTQNTIPTPTDANAMSPVMVCSKARQIAGVIFCIDPITPLWTLQFCVSLDNAITWTVTRVTQLDTSMGRGFPGLNYAQRTCSAASGTHDVFILLNGDVVRHQTGTTGYEYLTAALPACEARIVSHIGSGCFIAFTATLVATLYTVTVQRSIDDGATWFTIPGTGLTGLQCQYVGMILVDAKYENSVKTGRLLVPVYLSGTTYKLYLSTDVGQTWAPYSSLPNALAPNINPAFPIFSNRIVNVVDLGASEKLSPSPGVYDLLLGTDPSRAESMVEI